ncbi:MAG: alpha-L-rhamnosidase N-terminal domain-containing protein, partial [Trebonia sp.]
MDQQSRSDANPALGRRRFMTLGGGVLGGLGVTFATGPAALARTTGGPPEAAGPGGSQLLAGNLQAASMTDPVGIDVTPALGWKLAGELNRAPDGPTGAVQTAYQIQVASDATRLQSGRPDLWDSGKVRSARNYQIAYEGKPVPARTRACWRVRVWDGEGRASQWSEPAFWETGLLQPADWTAHWIGNGDWEQPHPLTAPLSSPQTARYVQLTVTDLGQPAAPLGSPDFLPQLQMAEFVLLNSAGADPTADLALNAAVTASESDTVPGQWAPQYLTDGKITSATAPYGYQSAVHPETDVSAQPITATFDLGQDATFDTAVLYQRWDAPSQWGVTPDYPRTFTIGVGDSAGGPFTTVASVHKDDKPYPPSSLHAAPAGLPLFAKRFSVARTPVARARLYVSCAGIHITTVNGRPATPNVLEPPVSNVLDEAEYATYDVTSLLRPGPNAVGMELGTGTWDIFNTPAAPSRYIKATAGFGPPRMIAQLEIDYADGSRQTVASDGSWLTGLGATTFSNWYGGED